MVYRFNKIGFHVGPAGGNMTGIGTYFQALTNAGIPIVLKSVDNYGPIWEALNGNPHPASQFCYRLSAFRDYKGVTWDPNVPRYELSPYDAAYFHMERTIHFLPPEFDRTRVKLEIINEPDKTRAEWLAEFSIHCMGYLNIHGITDLSLRLLSWSAGEPEPEHWRGQSMLLMLSILSRHGIALHEYSLANDIKAGEPYMVGRHLDLFQACDEEGIPRPKVWISEFGWRQEWVPGETQAIQDIHYVGTKYYNNDPNIEAAGIWYLGPGFQNVADLTQKLIVPVTNYSINYGIEEVEEQNPVDKQKAIVVKLPQDMTAQEWQDASAVAYSFKHTMTASHNDMLTILYGGNAQSFVKFSHPARDAAAISLVEAAGYNWEPLYQNPPDTTPLPGAPMAVEPLNQRASLWANKIIGQPSGHGKTIGNWGCLLVAYNMMANYLGFTNRYPDAENAHYVSKNAFAGPYIREGALQLAYPGQIEYQGYMQRSNPAMRSMVREYLNAGIPVPARVDFNPISSDFDQHWVLIVGYIGESDFWMCDPWHGDLAIVNQRYAISGSDLLEALFYKLPDDPGGPQEPLSDPAFGIHASANPDFAAGEIDMYKVFQPEAFKLLSFHNPTHILSTVAAFPNALYVVRAFISGHDANGPRNISPQQFFNDTVNDVQRTLDIVGDDAVIELHNEPNLKLEGWTGGWQNASQFVDWLNVVVDLYKARFPNAKLIFPGLSPGLATPERDHYMNYLSALVGHPVLGKLHGIGVHTYWSDAFGGYQTTDPHSSLNVIHTYNELFPSKPLYITEASNNGQSPDAQKAEEYVSFWEDLHTFPNIKAVCYYVASDVSGTYKNEAWLGTQIPVLVKDR